MQYRQTCALRISLKSATKVDETDVFSFRHAWKVVVGNFVVKKML